MSTFSTLAYHLRHPLTWMPSAQESSAEATRKPLIIPHSFGLWAPSLIGVCALSFALHTKGKKDYRILIAACFLAITTLFYLTTYLIKSCAPNLDQELKERLRPALREAMLSFIKVHGEISPIAYLPGHKHNANEWRALFYNTSDNKTEKLLQLRAQNTLAWHSGYKWTSVPVEAHVGLIERDLPHGTPFTQVELKVRVPWGEIVFHSEDSSSIAEDFIHIDDDGLLEEMQPQDRANSPDISQKKFYRTKLNMTDGGPLEVYNTLAAIQTYSTPQHQGQHPACPPIILTLCPNGEVVQPDLARRTALSEITTGYFRPDKIHQASARAEGLALYVPGTPLFRGCEEDGYPFLKEPLPVDVLCVYHNESAKSLEEGAKAALRCALDINPHHKKKAFCNPPLVYRHLVIPIDGINVRLWHSLFSNEQYPEFLGQFAEVNFTFSDSQVQEAFSMTWSQLSEPPPPPPPSRTEQAVQIVRSMAPSEEQTAAALEAGRTVLDVTAQAGSQGLRVATRLGAQAALSVLEYLADNKS